MTISDEAWVAAARERVARGGSWEQSPDAAIVALKAHRANDADSSIAPACPFCPDRRKLEVFRRYELQSVDPLWYCSRCYGFWAAGDSVARGVADAGYSHPALEAVQAPRRCRSCFGHLRENGTCVKCGQTLPLFGCPSCGVIMTRFTEKGITLDSCGACRGTWFDMGEIADAYGLEPPQSLAASTVDEHAMDDAPPTWWLALLILLRAFIPLP